MSLGSEAQLTILILTLNEEIHLKRLLESVSSLNAEIVIVDSGSVDGTEEISRKAGCRFFYNPWKNYAEQFQWGLDNCGINTRWVMRMDADEYIDSVMAEGINRFLSESNFDGFYMKRKVIFRGRWIRFGGHYPQVLLRIWKHGEAAIEQRWMDEHIKFFKSEAKLGFLPGHIVDENLNSIGWFIDKHNRYASREAIDVLLAKFSAKNGVGINYSSGKQAFLKRIIKEKLYNSLPLGVRPILYFIYRYLFRLGFLDGRSGFFYHFFQGVWYRTLVDAKIQEFLSAYQEVNYKKDDVVEYFRVNK